MGKEVALPDNLSMAEVGMPRTEPEVLLHDLVGSLTTIKGSLSVAVNNWDRLDEALRRELLGAALRGADTLALRLERVRVALGDGRDGVMTPGRWKLVEVAVDRRGNERVAVVKLSRERTFAVGETTWSEDHGGKKAVVDATLEALSEHLDFPLDVQSADVLGVGDARLCIVTLWSDTELLVGSAAVSSDELEGMAKATLDALNRLIGKVMRTATAPMESSHHLPPPRV